MAREKVNPFTISSNTTNKIDSKTKRKRGKSKSKTKETFTDNIKTTDLKTGEVVTSESSEVTKSRTNKRGKTKTLGFIPCLK